MRARHGVLMMAVLLVVGGCPEPDPDRSDAGDPDCMAGALGDCVLPPQPPAEPVLVDWTCPADWLDQPAYTLTDEEREQGHAEPHRICAPPALPETCPAGERPLLGHSDCQPHGTACSGDWPSDLPESVPVWYVQAGGSGDGHSTGAPLGTIAAALSQAQDGDIVALARGTYSEAVQIARAVTLWGACVAETVIEAPSARVDRGTVEIGAGGGAVVTNLTVTGPRPGVWILDNAVTGTLRHVRIDAAQMIGVFVSDDGKALLEDVVITGTLSDPADLEMGRGLQVRTGGHVELRRSVLEHNRDLGVTVTEVGASVKLVDSVVRDTLPQESDGAWGQGLEVIYGARAELTRCLFERNRNSGMVAAHEGTELVLRDVVIRETLPQENNSQYGGGMEVAVGALVTGQQVLFEDNTTISLVTGNEGTRVEFEDLVVRRTRPRLADGVFGNGMTLQMGSEVTLRRAAFVANRFAEILASSPSTLLVLEDVILRETLPQEQDGERGAGLEVNSGAQVRASRLRIERTADSATHLGFATQVELSDLTIQDVGLGGALQYGRGLNVQTGASVTVERARIDGAAEIGVHVNDEGTQLLGRDIQVLNTRTNSAGLFGRAFNVQEGGRAILERVYVDHAREAAVVVAGVGASVEVHDLWAQDIAPGSTVMAEGRGFSVQDGAQATVARAVFQRGREVGVFAYGVGSRLDLDQIWVADTQLDGLQGFGHGVVARDGAWLSLARSVVTGNSNVGVAYSNAGGSISASLVEANAVGLFAGDGATLREVESLPDDPGALEVVVTSDTRFENNTTRLGSGSIPLPDLLDLMSE